MFIGKIIGGCWEEGKLYIGEMPTDFELSFRSVRILELNEYEDLIVLYRQLAEALKATLDGLPLPDDSCNDPQCNACIILSQVKAALEAAEKAGIET